MLSTKPCFLSSISVNLVLIGSMRSLNSSLISCSDAHSPQKLGREVCVFDTEMNYKAMFEAIKTKDKSKFLYTVEFYPEEGKYHYDGHRKCNVSWKPKQTKANKEICSVCGKKVTVGVMSRVDDLADREEGVVPQNAIPFKSMIPLQEIIAEVRKRGVNTKGVQEEYFKLIGQFGSEFKILLDTPIADLPGDIGGAVEKVRAGKVKIEPGYDGEFGVVGI